MLANDVLYTVSGKMFFMDKKELFETYVVETENTTERIPQLRQQLPRNEKLIGGEFGLYQTGSGGYPDNTLVCMVNVPQAVNASWRVQTTMGSAYYHLIDGNNEGRVLYDVEIPMGQGQWTNLRGGKKSIKYIHDVIANFSCWQEYDVNGSMLNPAEELLEENERKSRVKQENIANRNEALDLIMQLKRTNYEGGPGSRKRAEQLLDDLNLKVSYINLQMKASYINLQM